MNRHGRLSGLCAVIAGLGLLTAVASPGLAGAPDEASFSLQNVYAGSTVPSGLLVQDTEEAEEEVISEETTVETYEGGMGWSLEGPYYLRSADPIEPGEMEFKLISGYSTASDGTDDDTGIEFAFEWGMMENVHMYIETGLELGDGSVEGNADIKALGFHTRFWKEDGWIPAVAMRNEMRIPTGYHSDGVDYEGRLLVTKSIVPDTLRAHFNPFLRLNNGDNELEEDEHEGFIYLGENDGERDPRHFLWGVAAGVDWRVADDLVLVADYVHRSSTHRGDRNQHIFEFGADWKLAENHMLAFGGEATLDADGNEPNFGMKIAYIFSINTFRLDGG
ncbi:MAG TPA: hypothetical protein VM243_20710 [Phycisphaerae bacterium]|nr:hypothetical protein [Phycisphaerae bacterium]